MGILESLINIQSLLFGVGALIAAHHNIDQGRIAVVSPNILATSYPEIWARSNSHPGYTRSKWFYRPIRYDWRMDNVFSQVDIKKHDARRKQMIPGYSGKENLTLEADIDACMRQMIELVRTRYAAPRGSRGRGPRPMDLAQKVQFFTLDAISTIGFGRCFGMLADDADPDGYVAAAEAGLHNANTQMALGTWWTNWLPLVGPRFDANLATARGFDKMMALSASMVEARERAFRARKEKAAAGVLDGEGGEKADMLTSFLKNGLEGAELKSEVVLQIVAGSDTTAGAIRGTLLYIFANPRVYKVLQAEIDEAVRSGFATPAAAGSDTTPADPTHDSGADGSGGAAAESARGVISYAKARQLPYLQAVIREGLRIFPPVTDPFGRDTPPGGDTVTIGEGADEREVFLPGGVSVIPSFVAMCRDRAVFGEDADVFRPERWLDESDPERVAAMRRVVDLDFGHGRYLCLGKSMAMMELSKVIFEKMLIEYAVSAPETLRVGSAEPGEAVEERELYGASLYLKPMGAG
ncbi:hypothetical protein SLS62_010359 [Diatrype stigma]|uniref:Cytochrome P450 n=1 Tax=Diatrype stigma TaxID=117547 RepID=A0AAN9UAI0_9PEZI